MVNPYGPLKARADTHGLPGLGVVSCADRQSPEVTRARPRWLTRILWLFTPGGGVTGLAFTAHLQLRAADAMSSLLLLLFLLIFALGTFARWRLSEVGSTGIRRVRRYLALQVPFISSLPLLWASPTLWACAPGSATGGS